MLLFFSEKKRETRMETAFDAKIENPFKDVPTGRNMQTVYFALVVLFGLGIVGGAIELFAPGLISDKMSELLVALSIGTLLLAVSFFFLILLLKGPTREGFASQDPMSRWVLFYETSGKRLCDFYTEIYQSILKVEGGVAPNTVPEAQARERTMDMMKKKMGSGPVSCAKIEALYRAAKKEDLDTFFTELQPLPNSFLVQVYDTAVGCKELLIENYNRIMASLQRRSEGFVDAKTPVCSPDVTEQRRKFLREQKLSEEMKQCLLPEEVPLDRKEDYVETKLKAMTDGLAEATKGKASLQKVLEDCAYYKGELDKLKQQAESGKMASTSVVSV
jgi:hypothetical protein